VRDSFLSYRKRGCHPGRGDAGEEGAGRQNAGRRSPISRRAWPAGWRETGSATTSSGRERPAPCPRPSRACPSADAAGAAAEGASVQQVGTWPS
jgi:hypothetical protein